jgi:hypothetical protein
LLARNQDNVSKLGNTIFVGYVFQLSV